MRRGDHLCWVYDDASSFAESALSFLRDGLEAGERISFVADADVAESRAGLASLGDVDALIARGDLVIINTSDRYSGAAVGPLEQVTAYKQATDEALALGYTGLRVAADVTSLVVQDDDRQRFAAYEHAIDRAMRAFPFTAMCAYNRRVLGDAVADIACLHPATNVETAGFHLCAGDDVALALSGEIDFASAPTLASALRHVIGDDRVLWVDATGLRFIDHHGLLVFEELDGVERVVLRTRFTLAARMAELLGLQRVVIETVR